MEAEDAPPTVCTSCLMTACTLLVAYAETAPLLTLRAAEAEAPPTSCNSCFLVVPFALLAAHTEMLSTITLWASPSPSEPPASAPSTTIWHIHRWCLSTCENSTATTK